MASDGKKEVEIGEGWDRYCGRAAGGRLLRIAAFLWEAAGAKGNEDARHALDITANRLKKLAFTDLTEEAFVEAMESLEGADVEAAVREVKERGRELRGQLSLFDKAAGPGGALCPTKA